jgi:histidine triad (HIT) family protein
MDYNKINKQNLSMQNNCIFCKILNREPSDKIVYVTENWVTLEPKEKVSKGHILVIPTFHCRDILDLTDTKSLKELGCVLQKVSKSQIEKYNADGINILNANRKSAQQSVSHLHFHIIPRYKDDNLDLWIRKNKVF